MPYGDKFQLPKPPEARDDCCDLAIRVGRLRKHEHGDVPIPWRTTLKSLMRCCGEHLVLKIKRSLPGSFPRGLTSTSAALISLSALMLALPRPGFTQSGNTSRDERYQQERQEPQNIAPPQGTVPAQTPEGE